jgi:serine protease
MSTSSPTRPSARRLRAASACGLIVFAVGAGARAASAAGPLPRRIVVRYSEPTGTAVAAGAGATSSGEQPGRTVVLKVPAGESLNAQLRVQRRRRGVQWAVPDYVAHTAGALVPDDEGATKVPGGWQELQWNFAGPFGIGAPEAWSNVAAAGAAGGRGVVVAVLDTGVAYANRGRFRLSPDFGRWQFVKGYDFVSHDPYPNDRNGHGTFVAGTVAEETNNLTGLTGLAYGARIMPVRVLDTEGEGEASTIAEGVRFAVDHGARVINLSLEFSPGVTASDIPELIEALRYAHRHRVLVVAAAGNEGHTAVAYPAHAPYVVSVGATTEHGCLAAYSNDGSGLTLVAPGGGADADLPGDPNCDPEKPGADIYQLTFTGSSVQRFGLPSGYEGTSMATPHVSAAAALVIATGVLGPHPTPAQLTARLRATARRLGGGGDERLYGAGLLNAAAATAPGGPGAVAKG